MIQICLICNKLGDIRLAHHQSSTEFDWGIRQKLNKEIIGIVLQRRPNALQDKDDNELIGLEIIRHLVKTMDLYFGSVCELDLVYKMDSVGYLVNEAIVAGSLCESSTKCLVESLIQADIEEDPSAYQTLETLDLLGVDSYLFGAPPSRSSGVYE